MDYTIFIDLTIELIFGFIALLVAVRIIGKRQLQQVNLFDFVSAIVLGEFLGNAIYQNEIKVYHIAYAIAIWTLLVFCIEKITQKSFKVRNIIEGSSVLIIKNGLIDFKILKEENLNLNEILTQLRNKNVFSIREVEYAIIEPNGAITIIKNSACENVQKKDLNIPFQPALLNLPLIMDGKIDFKNLNVIGYDQDWLNQNLKQQNVEDVKDVLYAEWNKTEGFYIQRVSN